MNLVHDRPMVVIYAGGDFDTRTYCIGFEDTIVVTNRVACVTVWGKERSKSWMVLSMSMPDLNVLLYVGISSLRDRIERNMLEALLLRSVIAGERVIVFRQLQMISLPVPIYTSNSNFWCTTTGGGNFSTRQWQDLRKDPYEVV